MSDATRQAIRDLVFACGGRLPLAGGDPAMPPNPARAWWQVEATIDAECRAAVTAASIGAATIGLRWRDRP